MLQSSNLYFNRLHFGAFWIGSKGITFYFLTFLFQLINSAGELVETCDHTLYVEVNKSRQSPNF